MKQNLARLRVPKLGIHKASGHARVVLNGKEVYLGKPGPEAELRIAQEVLREEGPAIRGGVRLGEGREGNAVHLRGRQSNSVGRVHGVDHAIEKPGHAAVNATYLVCLL